MSSFLKVYIYILCCTIVHHACAFQNVYGIIIAVLVRIWGDPEARKTNILYANHPPQGGRATAETTFSSEGSFVFSCLLLMLGVLYMSSQGKNWRKNEYQR